MTRGYFDKRKQRKVTEVLTKYLRYKGLEADIFKFTTKLHKDPDYSICGYNIAVQRSEYLGKDCIYFSIVL